MPYALLSSRLLEPETDALFTGKCRLGFQSAAWLKTITANSAVIEVRKRRKTRGDAQPLDSQR
jgi:hypothetical protein